MRRLRDGDRRHHRTALTDPVDIVERGYDAIAGRFAEWQSEIADSQRREWAEELLGRLAPAAEVLELGVGAGVSSSRMLAERARLTGVDVSTEQLRRARTQLPRATLIQADFTQFEFPRDSFDAVVAFYVLNHVPRERLAPLLAQVAQWLRPRGLFLASFPSGDNPGSTGEWLGAEMFFAGFDAEANRGLVGEAGLRVLRDERETSVEPDHGEVTWQWLLAEKPE